MSRISNELEEELRQYYTRFEPYTLRSICKSELGNLSRLSIVAYLFSWPDTIGSAGDVDIVTKGGQLLRINYRRGNITYDDLLGIIPSLEKDIDDNRLWKSGSDDAQWHWLEIRSRCWLRVHDSIWAVFSKSVERYGAYLEPYWPCLVLSSLMDVFHMPAKTNDLPQKPFGVACKELIYRGAHRYNKLRVIEVRLFEEEKYLRVSLSVSPSIPGMISKDKGTTWELGQTNQVHTSSYALAALFKEDPETSWFADSLIEDPGLIEPIMKYGYVDIIQQKIEKGQPYVNPFSSLDNPPMTTFSRDVVLNYVVGFHFGLSGRKFADELAVKWMGF